MSEHVSRRRVIGGLAGLVGAAAVGEVLAEGQSKPKSPELKYSDFVHKDIIIPSSFRAAQAEQRKALENLEPVPKEITIPILEDGFWRSDKATWVGENVPVRINPRLGSWDGLYYTGTEPGDPGHIEVGKDAKPSVIIHESHHAIDSDQTPPYTSLNQQFLDWVKRDAEKLMSMKENFPLAAQAVEWIEKNDKSSTNVVHWNHILLQAIDWDISLVPTWYAKDHFSMMRTKSRIYLPLGH
jgi:hypothetical protein